MRHGTSGVNGKVISIVLITSFFYLMCASCSDSGDPHDIEGLSFVTIPAGTFRMGDIQGGGGSYERPVHDVTLTGFEMSVYEVTNAQYVKYLTEAQSSGEIAASGSMVKGKTGDWSGQEYLDISSDYCHVLYNRGSFSVKTGKEKHPVHGVTWYGAKAFAEYYGFDLPTEAEWEYACRAGAETKFSTGNNLSSDAKTSTDLDRAGWYYGNSNTGEDGPWTHPVGQKKPNAWGIYDMHGNVWEWCCDWYDPDYYSLSSSKNPTGAQIGSRRVGRGGGYCHLARTCRSADRNSAYPDFCNDYMGFRVVRR